MTPGPPGGSASEGHGSIDGMDVVPFSMSGEPRSDTMFWVLFLTFAVLAVFGIAWIVLDWLS